MGRRMIRCSVQRARVVCLGSDLGVLVVEAVLRVYSGPGRLLEKIKFLRLT